METSDRSVCSCKVSGSHGGADKIVVFCGRTPFDLACSYRLLIKINALIFRQSKKAWYTLRR